MTKFSLDFKNIKTAEEHRNLTKKYNDFFYSRIGIEKIGIFQDTLLACLFAVRMSLTEREI